MEKKDKGMAVNRDMVMKFRRAIVNVMRATMRTQRLSWEQRMRMALYIQANHAWR